MLRHGIAGAPPMSIMSATTDAGENRGLKSCRAACIGSRLIDVFRYAGRWRTE